MGLSGGGDIFASCSFGGTWGIYCDRITEYAILIARSVKRAILIARSVKPCDCDCITEWAILLLLVLLEALFWETVFLVEGYLLFVFLSFGSSG